MIKNKKNNIVMPYNIAVIDDDSAEIDMYGEVIMKAPRDYWTNEIIQGTYIAADEFLNDLENIKDKKNITIHINSGGGDLYAGLAIYNRLKTLSGHITTINDGLAASAASLIFQAGDTRKMNKGSNLMAHGASGFLFGYYNVEEMQAEIKRFKAHNKAIVNVYAEAMGVTQEDAKAFVSGETWLTGQEAVDKGLADEVVEAENNIGNRLMNSFMSKITKNGINPTIMTLGTQTAYIEETGGKEKMEIEIKNVQDLKAAYPDLVKQIENDAATSAVKAERERIKSIEEISASITDKNMLYDAKFGEDSMTAENLALKAMKTQTQNVTEMINKIEDDIKNSGADQVSAAPIVMDEEDEETKVQNMYGIYNKVFKKGGEK